MRLGSVIWLPWLQLSICLLRLSSRLSMVSRLGVAEQSRHSLRTEKSLIRGSSDSLLHPPLRQSKDLQSGLMLSLEGRCPTTRVQATLKLSLRLPRSRHRSITCRNKMAPPGPSGRPPDDPRRPRRLVSQSVGARLLRMAVMAFDPAPLDGVPVVQNQ